MELKLWTYDEFPEFDRVVEGAKTIPTTGEERGVICRGNIQYAKADGIPLHMHILIPSSRNCPPPMPGMPKEKAGVKYPCIVFVQGSAWMQQDLFMQLLYIAELAKRGYVTAIVEYRHSGQASFPAPVIDARNAVRFLRANADAYRIDAGKMILAGDSSGGHTALFGGMRHDDDSKDTLFPGISGEVSGVIALYPSSNFLLEDSNPSTPNHLAPDSPEGLEMGGQDLRKHPELCEQLTVECNIHEDTVIPPVLLFHGTKDRIVNCECNVSLYSHMKKLGKAVELYLVKGADHGGAEFWTDQTIDIMEAFIKSVL